MKKVVSVLASCGLLLLTGAVARAEALLPSRCSATQVHSSRRPLLAADGSRRGTFLYRFHVNEPQETGGPVVIFIPGGPGQTSFTTPLSYPENFQVVRTDPRGTGCNNDLQLVDTDITSQEIALDILSIVRELKPKHYILHGVSYGTVVALMAASLASTTGLPAPTAVVLEGVIGQAFQANSYDRDFIQRWEEARGELSPAVLKRLSVPNPLGIPSRNWTAWLSGFLLYGHFADGDSLLKRQLNALETLDLAADVVASREAFLKRSVEVLTKEPLPERKRLHRLITCHELAPDMRDVQFDFDWQQGHLVASDLRMCAQENFDRPYDSKTWPVRSPLYLFSGEEDPATPPYQAQYLFAHQKGPRVLVQVRRGGHQALSGSLMDCANNLWSFIAAANDPASRDFSAALKECQMAVDVQQRSISN